MVKRSGVLEARRNTREPGWSEVWRGPVTPLRREARDLNRRLGWTKYRVREVSS